MVRGTNAAKREQWTKRLERFSQAGQSVTEFCRAEGVSAPSFYQWRRRLLGGGRIEPKTGRPPRKSSSFRRLRVPPQPNMATGVRVRWPDGIVLELGYDLPTIERIVGQLLDHQAAESEAC